MIHFFANWKMYLNLDESICLAEELKTISFDPTKLTVAVFPSALAFTKVADALRGTSIALGAQNINWTPRGAYTGAISAELFREAGATYAIIGHSERRYIFGESNDVVRQKFVAALDAGLTPVLCVGETPTDLQEGKREYRLQKQLSSALKDVPLRDKSFCISYEPVWAVGTGNPCHPSDAAEMHALIESEVKQYTDAFVPVLYGGSVTADNIASYLSHAVVDGVLVGSASTKPETVRSMIGLLQQETSV